MLPVAFTCPLWWVARWATRVLTSLAVLSLALGAAPALLPASVSAAPPSTIGSPARAEPLGPSSAGLSTVRADRAVGGRAVADRAVAGRAVADWAALGQVADAGPARSVDPQPALNDALAVLPGPPMGGSAAGTGAEPSLRAAGSASRAPRAPPA
ncbi:hypothetical protein [Micromonospora sp. WMMD736]|uniref:hypothetical protein n=1 Tax=Micromonospora sp. WMMD736 TaxID=3404112 RepID=UPI003B951CA5